MTPANRRALARLLRAPRYEVLPLPGVDERVAALPAGATVTVTCSPSKGLDPTIAVAESLRAAGRTVVPHLAARQVRDDVHLKEVVDRLSRAGVRDVFVVGGDRDAPLGPFTTGLELLDALHRLDHPFSDVGVPAYPEGHRLAGHAELLRLLRDKQRYATYMVTQLCFDAGTVRDWLARARAAGIELPCLVGIPGAVDAARLLRVSLRLGIGDSARFLRGNRTRVLRLLRPGGHRPDRLVRRLAALARDERLGITGVHVFTFDQVEHTARWVAQLQGGAHEHA